MGVEPDILTLAKPLAGGLPMGATLLTDRIADAVRAGDHATTFGGGPLVSSVALEVVERVAARSFLAGVRERGERVAAVLRKWVGKGIIREARGLGLIQGVELAEAAAPAIERALEAGLLLVAAGERVVRILPPLTIDEDELDQGLKILEEVLS